MTPEKQREELIFGLKRTGSEEVHVSFSQVASVLGEKAASDLCVYKGQVQQAMFKKNANSLVPESQRVKNLDISGFNRVTLLEALEAAKKPQPAKI